jgi:biopolymer transport protein ExbD
MAFNNKKQKTLPAISTASLPDIVFMLLFFFMVTTVLRETDIKLNISPSSATQLEQIEKKSLVSHLFVGYPKEAKYGKEARIQVNDVILDEPKQVQQWVFNEKAKLKPEERSQHIISFKVDKTAKVGIVSDIETELRNIDSRRVLYNANKAAQLK